MNKLFTIAVAAFFCTSALGQRDISNWSKSAPDNISIERLAGDSLTTSFVIQIRNEVPLHFMPTTVNMYIFFRAVASSF